MSADQPSLFAAPAALPDPRANQPGKAFHGAPDTTRSAAMLIHPASGTARWRVLRALASGPRTDEELQDALAMNPSTQRPRRLELVEGGWVRDSGQRRRTRSGRWAEVWEVTPEGQAALPALPAVVW